MSETPKMPVVSCPKCGNTDPKLIDVNPGVNYTLYVCNVCAHGYRVERVKE